MPACPICGLGERCRSHWIAAEDASGEVSFQTGVMTASEDNLVLLRNKLKNPPLQQLFERLQLAPTWMESEGRRLAYLPWPLDLRGAVHRALFPAGAPGAPAAADDEDVPLHDTQLEDLALVSVRFDTEHCLPDELLYIGVFELAVADLGCLKFEYVGQLWAEGVNWSHLFASDDVRRQAANLTQLLLAGVLDPLRASFAGRPVRLLVDGSGPLRAGDRVDEVVCAGREASPAQTELHLGEEIEALLHARRLAPLLRDSLLHLLAAPARVQ